MKRVKKQKKRSEVNEIRSKAFEEARWFLSKKIFPNFVTMVYTAVIDEIEFGHMKNFHLTEGEKKRLLKSIAERTERYAQQGRDGIINPYEAREAFEKSTGISVGEIFM